MSLHQPIYVVVNASNAAFESNDLDQIMQKYYVSESS